ncbi:hypothetical protein N7G274_007056 [Stereocaulon virgatum]|uniref:Uncharacterized protein n=1 Tax=Stereocaulon virgatum TaxID=373712 RepID=A0ABR4A3B0_9LECA
MVYYIRFLKCPKLDVKTGLTRALVTITTDLGDAFYPGDLTLHAMLVTDYREEPITEWRTVQWIKGMRSVSIEIGALRNCDSKLRRLLLNTQRTQAADTVLEKHIPEIFSARSGTFSMDRPLAGDKIERRYKTGEDDERSVYEETGESIARHVWDAGIALVAFLSNVTRQPFPKAPLAMILTRTTHGPKVLELGSGCGIVGLEIARLCPTSDVLLTDLPEAMAIMEYNVSEVKVSSTTGKITTAILDWNDALPAMIRQTQYNLVIVSDCTYNSDNIPALVKTLAAVVNKSPAALVVVSMKVRHDSEAIFFELMAEAGFVTVEDYAISLPDQQRGHIGQELDAVNVFVFRKD